MIWTGVFIAATAGLLVTAHRAGASRLAAIPAGGGASRRRRLAGLFCAFSVLLGLTGGALLAAILGAQPPVLLAATALSGTAAGGFAAFRIRPGFVPRQAFERLATGAMAVVAALAVLTTFSIFLTLIFETLRFFGKTPVTEFLFGTVWSPQIAIRADQIGGTGARARQSLKLILELLAGVPTVVYGFFALLFVGPAISRIAAGAAALVGVEADISAQNALSAGLVMGVMIIPFVSSLSHDVISAIPPSLREGAYALGATKAETVLRVLLPAAAPGLVGAFLLAVSRAVGETMIVVMAASRSANLTFNPLERVTTMTVQIVALLTGDQEFDSPKTLAAFALGLVLFLTTLALNVAALVTVKRFKLRYE